MILYNVYSFGLRESVIGNLISDLAKSIWLFKQVFLWDPVIENLKTKKSFACAAILVRAGNIWQIIPVKPI